jgi:hypothetical protein
VDRLLALRQHCEDFRYVFKPALTGRSARANRQSLPRPLRLRSAGAGSNSDAAARAETTRQGRTLDERSETVLAGRAGLRDSSNGATPRLVEDLDEDAIPSTSTRAITPSRGGKVGYAGRQLAPRVAPRLGVIGLRQVDGTAQGTSIDYRQDRHHTLPTRVQPGRR